MSFMFSLVVILIADASNASLGAQTAAPLNPAQVTEKLLPPEKSSYKHAERDWNVLISKLHTAQPPSDEEIRAFVWAAVGNIWAANSEEEGVCSAGLFKIAGSNSYDLVASLDVNGQRFCGDVEVIHRGANGLTIQSIFALGVDDVNDIVRDIDKNGKNELVIPYGLSEYAGARCAGSWDRIYSLQSGVLVDRSNAFKDFYREQLVSLKTDMQQVQAKKPHDYYDADSIVCLQMESDKIKRFLGISPNAGASKAIVWVKSGDDYLRGRGVAVLADIGDQESISILQHLTKDTNHRVAEDAKFMLQSRAVYWIKSGDEYWRRKGFVVLSEIKDEAVIKQFANDSDPDIARDARSALNEVKR